MLVRTAALAAVLAGFTFACSSPAPTSLNKSDSADQADDDDDSTSKKTDSKSSTSSKSSSTNAEPTKSTTSSQTAPTTTTTPTTTPPKTTTTPTTTGGGLLDSLPFKLSDLLGLLQGGGNGNGGFDLGGLLGGLFGGNGGGADLGGLANSQTLLGAPDDSTGCCVGTQFFVCGANTTTCSDAAKTCERAADLDDVCAQ